MSNAIEKHLIGLTGEYFVAGMMSLHGWVASLTLKNYPSVDIFGLDPKTGDTVSIQVKTTRNQSSYQIGLSHDQRNRIEDKIKCPYVFVHINRKNEISYYILSSKELIDLIESTDDKYFKQERTKSIKTDYPIAIGLKDLLDYENKWVSIWK